MNITYQLTPDQIKQLHQLYQKEWWTKDRTLEETQKCIQGSQICVGITDFSENLVGFSRVLTDYTFKAIIFDFIIENSHRSQGLGDLLISLVLQHESLAQVKHFELYCLPEMMPFYEKYGFGPDIGDISLMRLAR